VVPNRRLRKALLISALTALLTPAALGGMLEGASALADSEDTIAAATQAPAPKPAPAPHRRTLSSLGRASAVAWIRIGHIGH